MRHLPLTLSLASTLLFGFTNDSIETIDTLTEITPLTTQGIEDLQFLREEEKLARDVYTHAYNLYGVNIFNNIASSEQRHTDSVLELMNRYEVEDTATATLGDFTDPELSQLCAVLIARVETSEAEAFAVGATIEDLDIYDLDLKATHTQNSELQNLYANLKCGSENHMRSFTKKLTALNLTYIPEYIDAVQYTEILAAPQGGCGN
jgi:hypothetical protein